MVNFKINSLQFIKIECKLVYFLFHVALLIKKTIVKLKFSLKPVYNRPSIML